MGDWLLQLFRVAIVIAALSWAIEAGDLSQRARGFVETALANATYSIDR